MTEKQHASDAPPCTVAHGPSESRAVDEAVCTRQCLGAGFEKRRDYSRRAEELLGGLLRLAPHKDWAARSLADWTADPFGSRNWQFQHHALRWLSPLRYAADDGDEAARDLWLDTTRSWIQDNPPGGSASQFAWMDMADGLRAQELVFGWPYARTEADRELLLSSLIEHGLWLADETHLSEGNHALHQNTGLFVVSCFLRRDDWRQLALERLAELFSRSFDAEGANNEGSIQYHQHNLTWWQNAWERIGLEGVETPSDILSRLHLAAEFLAHAVRPDGTLVPIGDTHLRRIKAGAWPELEYVASLGETGTPPAAPTLVASNGYVLGRSGWGDQRRPFTAQSHYSIRFGPRATHHSHQDRGAVTFFSKGQDWVTDPGSYIYEPRDPFRRYLRSREAHNLVVIEDREYRPAGDVSLDKLATDDSAHDYQISDDNYEGVGLCRRVVYLPGLDLMIVVDTVNAEEPVTARQLWHVEPGVKPRYRDCAVEMQGQSGRRMTLNWLGAVPRLRVRYAAEDAPTGWVSRSWGEKQKAATVEAAMTARQGVLTAVMGDSTDDPWAVETSRARKAETWMRVIRFGRVWDVNITTDNVTVGEDKARTTALHRMVAGTGS